MEPSPLSGQFCDRFPQNEQNKEMEARGPINTKRLKKADREKLKRERLNEQFLELGIMLDPCRPKSDKATILSDVVEMLKELTAEVQRLKAEQKTLSEESNDLMQETGELKDEKAVLKADIENLNIQYHQRMRLMSPWVIMDPMVYTGTPPFSFQMMPVVPDAHHSSLQGHGSSPPLPSILSYPLYPSRQPHPLLNDATLDVANQYLAFPPYAPATAPYQNLKSPSGRSHSMQPSSRQHVLTQPLALSRTQDSISHLICQQENHWDTDQQGRYATESSACNSGNKGIESKCEDAAIKSKEGENVQSGSSCESSGSGCNLNSQDKVEEIAANISKGRKSTSLASCEKDLLEISSPSRHPNEETLKT